MDYKLLFRHIPDCQVILDEHLKICDISYEYEKVTHKERSAVIGKDFTTLFPQTEQSEKLSKILDSIRKVFETRKSVQLPTYRYDIYIDNGKKLIPKFWDAITYPISYEDGKVQYVLHKIEDVTEHIKDNQMFGQVGRADIFKVILDNIKDYAIFMLDVNGNIRTWNLGAKRINGYDSSEIIGKNFSIFYPEADLKNGKPEWELKEVIKNGRIEDENWRVKKDRSLFWASVTITAIKDENGTLLGFVKVTKDLTERKLAEERTIRAYEESAKLKEEFLANMSHEIRTPMNGLMSAANLLKDTLLNNEQLELVDILLQSADGLLKLTNDILDYSKMEADRVHILSEPFDLIQEITDTVHNYEKMITKPVEMHLNIAENVPHWAKGDRFRFHQVLSNIMDNAIKFTTKGKIVVEVNVSENKIEIDKNFKLIISVSDTGIGISKTDTERLFAPFSQLDAFATKRYKGTGLGLTISKRLVELMGGEIYVESELGKGSKFTFTISLIGTEQQKLKQERVRTALVTSIEAGSKFLENKIDTTILQKPLDDISMLIAEDNKINQNVVVRILKKMGYNNILLAEKGQEAVDIFKNERVDIIIMDIQMPVMDGYEATRQIRAIDAHVPIIAMTANALKGDMEKCFDAGMNGYIPKPISIPSLMKMLKGNMS
jgi:osomolarity two-component system sensor histidine kinase TcsA